MGSNLSNSEVTFYDHCLTHTWWSRLSKTQDIDELRCFDPYGLPYEKWHSNFCSGSVAQNLRQNQSTEVTLLSQTCMFHVLINSQANTALSFCSISHFAPAVSNLSISLGVLQQNFGLTVSEQRALACSIFFKFKERICPCGRKCTPIEGFQTLCTKWNNVIAFGAPKRSIKWMEVCVAACCSCALGHGVMGLWRSLQTRLQALMYSSCFHCYLIQLSVIYSVMQ